VILEPGELGDLIILQHGRRRMPLAYTHLLPATFGGKAMFNVQNAMAAAGAAYCAGEHLHDIRAGLRSFTPSYYSAPGRMNMTEVKGIKVIVDYCHNAPAMVALGDFVDRFFEDSAAWERPQRIGVIATAGDRRDQGHDRPRAGVGQALRSDHPPGGRPVPWQGAGGDRGPDRAGRQGGPGRGLPAQADRGRARRVRGHQSGCGVGESGDLVVVCVDRAREVWDELQTLGHRAQAGRTSYEDR